MPVTMPRDWYRERIANGSITEADLAAALAASRHPAKPANLAELQAAIALDRPAPAALANVAELAAKASGTDWPGIVADRMGSWLAGYFRRRSGVVAGDPRPLRMGCLAVQCDP
ncbi:putative inorganic carbon transporter subunit DabA [Novosphingobium ginsenosidimutans]|uniref:putative inorganic carbon transporter subunit DabA n=1 Tax=Novosphingobium ginsenosidimutans TaxID=1176536 RepID=UPI0023562127|nr:putative inorganic carbon transporter subunit DabA [Novosphingobium ginsenosidimutans]